LIDLWLDAGVGACNDERPRAVCALEIFCENDRFWASGEARRFAASVGFGAAAQARIALCVAELASNAAKHAGCGRMELVELFTPARGCRVRIEDEGPGIPQLDEALCDGFSEGRWLTPDVPLSERRGLGVGLGTVVRLMSDVRVLPRPGGGLRIEATLWQTPERSSEDGKEVEAWRKR
jgi:serine/threonine-protein kinase RsbT